MADWIGWLATFTLTCSYLCKQPRTLRRVQALAALFWLAYGILIHATPVIVANILVAAAAVGSSFRSKGPVGNASS
jgi:uncharacterized protein with PQ loop repeat